MTRYAALVAVLLAVALTGTACGARPIAAAGSGSSTPTTSAAASAGAPSAHACPHHIIEGQETEADLDGDGTPDQVVFSGGAGGACPAGLTARIEGRQVIAATDSLRTVASMRAVTVPGRKGQLLVVRQTHPRGGFQVHLFGYADGQLAELTLDGQPVLPFVATDTDGGAGDGFTARCTQDGIEVTKAVAHQPIGVAPAFDVVATTYTIDGTTLRSSGTQKVRDNVLGADLPGAYPALAKRDVLTEGCS